MFDFLFKRRTLVYITIIVLGSALISLFYQLFFHDSPEKRINKAILNSYIIKYNDSLFDTICSVRTDRGYEKYIFCDYEKGCYFGHGDSNELSDADYEIRDFIQKGKTVLKKKTNSRVAHFINDQDTLVVRYKVYRPNGALYEGLIVK